MLRRLSDNDGDAKNAGSSTDYRVNNEAKPDTAPNNYFKVLLLIALILTGGIFLGAFLSFNVGRNRERAMLADNSSEMSPQVCDPVPLIEIPPIDPAAVVGTSKHGGIVGHAFGKEEDVTCFNKDGDLQPNADLGHCCVSQKMHLYLDLANGLPNILMPFNGKITKIIDESPRGYQIWLKNYFNGAIVRMFHINLEPEILSIYRQDGTVNVLKGQTLGTHSDMGTQYSDIAIDCFGTFVPVRDFMSEGVLRRYGLWERNDTVVSPEHRRAHPSHCKNYHEQMPLPEGETIEEQWILTPNQ